MGYAGKRKLSIMFKLFKCFGHVIKPPIHLPELTR